MTLHDTEALVIETGSTDLTPTLPDPTTVSGRTHILNNTATAATVWGSTGATPFTVDGTNVASLSITGGRLRQVQSDGAHWIAAPTAGRRTYAGSAVSDGSGNATFTFTPAFSVMPDVVQGVQTTNTNVTEARITALSTSSCTVNVRQSPSVVILGISVLQTPGPLTGATVHLIAVEPGQGV